MQIQERTRQTSGAAALSFTHVDLSAFHPDMGAKYSPNLYQFLAHRRNKGLAARARVFSTADSTMYIGFFDDTGCFIGARMSRVLCYGAKVEVTCPMNLGDMAEVEDFWYQYARDGRCAIDRAHDQYFLNAETRWATQGNLRCCQWCKQVSQRLVLREDRVVTDQWVNS